MHSAQPHSRSQTRATRRTRPQVWAHYTAALALVFAMVGSSAPRAASGNSGKGSSANAEGQATAETHRAHVDLQLADRLGRENDNEVVRVIITVKPGAKRRGLLQALKAQGATISADYTIIDALAAELPVGLLRALQEHPDIVAISTDAAVGADGLSTSVVGQASSDHRPRLG